MERTVAEIRNKARELLESGRVEVVIGFAGGTVAGKSTPCFIEKPADCDKLVWDQGCKNNLAVYLTGEKRRSAIVAKGCDSRSIVNLITENQLKGDEIFIIGAACPLEQGCAGCATRSPAACDFLAGEALKNSGEDDFSDVRDFQVMSREKRKEYFYREVSKCMRCYACRNACPACYCKECFVESSLPRWVGKSGDIADNIVFHLTRAIHTAGRCTGCGACARACPMGVDLMMLNRKMLKEVKELYGFTPGMSLDQVLPLSTHDARDPEHFLAGGGGE